MKDQEPVWVSRNNPRIKQIRALRQRKERDRTGLFLVEGIRHIGEAVEASAQIETLCYAPDLLTSAFAQELVKELGNKGTLCLTLEADVFTSLAEKDNPQGILAVARKPGWTLEQLGPDHFSWGVALVSPQDPGNVGTILRTIDAAGASGLLLLESSTDPYHPNAVRSSMGALFWHPVVQASFIDFIDWARRQSYALYGTSAHGSTDYRSIEQYHSPCILLMGSEREGLSSEQAQQCDFLLRLPMHGKVTSLNLAVAAGVMLYAMEPSIKSSL